MRPILGTVSRMRGRAMQFDTSQLGGVTNAMSGHDPLFSKPDETQRAPTTIGQAHEDPPPGSADDNEVPLTPTGPTTRIAKRPRGPRGGHDDRRTANTMPYHDLGTPSQSAVTHHNALCLVPDSDSAQLPVADLLSRQLVFDLFFLKTHPLQICMCQSLL